MFSVQRTVEGSQSTFFRATLRLRTCVSRRWVFERSHRILATELPTVPKPSMATLQILVPAFCELSICELSICELTIRASTALLPGLLRFEGPVMIFVYLSLLSPNGMALRSLHRTSTGTGHYCGGTGCNPILSRTCSHSSLTRGSWESSLARRSACSACGNLLSFQKHSP